MRTIACENAKRNSTANANAYFYYYIRLRMRILGGCIRLRMQTFGGCIRMRIANMCLCYVHWYAVGLYNNSMHTFSVKSHHRHEIYPQTLFTLLDT